LLRPTGTSGAWLKVLQHALIAEHTPAGRAEQARDRSAGSLVERTTSDSRPVSPVAFSNQIGNQKRRLIAGCLPLRASSIAGV
jgi:hypothetical protein